MKEKNQRPHEIQSLTSTGTTPLQSHVAIVISMLLILVCVVAYPYATNQGPRGFLFFFIATSLASFAALMTSYLLLGQFLGTHRPSLAVLGSTYLFVGLINIPYLLVSPDLHIKDDFFNTSAYASIWLWIFAQIGYPLGILLYILIDRHYNTTHLSSEHTKHLLIFLTVIIPTIIIVLSIIAIDAYNVLPPITTGGQQPLLIMPVRIFFFGLNAFMCLSALLLLHRLSILHLWLRVSTLAALINISFTLYARGRYTVGWYVSRINGLMAATLVLCALLYEVNKLYTKLVQQNEELAKQNRIQSDFLSVVGHEFRTALTSILGFSEMMREKDLDSQDIQEYADDIHSDATRLTRLINDLLDLERMKSGRIEMNWEEIDINALIQEIMDHTYATSRPEQIQLGLDPHISPIKGDRDKLTQVITNLVNNAVKYSPDGGSILIGSKQEGNTAHFFVQDHGMGIPAGKLDQVFERYARVESDTSRYIGGTGLGLPIVRQIVEMHNGKVHVESILEKGSTFHVKLPITSHAEPANKTSQLAVANRHIR
ncbi:MAG: MASE4 domain-containing protein [Ktedonobacteraceae bacterium]|nr:MASE4 domain-containing protein [Ktedonobacteraceae bacterium]